MELLRTKDFWRQRLLLGEKVFIFLNVGGAKTKFDFLFTC